jgi:hypothetical protein
MGFGFDSDLFFFKEARDTGEQNGPAEYYGKLNCHDITSCVGNISRIDKKRNRH